MHSKKPEFRVLAALVGGLAFFVSAVRGQATTASGPSTPAASATSASAPAAELSSPRATLIMVYTALRAGDIPTAKACLLFKDDNQEEVFNITCTQLYAPLKLLNAMESRFGEAAGRPFGTQPLERALDDLIARAKTAEIDVKGDTATVINHKAAINPSAENELIGITFKRDGERWKIVAATFSDAGEGAAGLPPGQMRFMKTLSDAVAAACAGTAARLARGDFKTSDEAYADYQARMSQGARAAASAAMSQTSTRNGRE